MNGFYFFRLLGKPRVYLTNLDKSKGMIIFWV